MSRAGRALATSMTLRRVVGCGLFVGMTTAGPAAAGPARGVQEAIRRFPTFGVFVRQLPGAEVAVVECDLFGVASDACTAARGRDLSAVLRILELPARRRRAADPVVTCATPVAWHGDAVRTPTFSCDALGDAWEAHVRFACQPREPDGTQYCTLHATSSNDDEDHASTWAYSVTGAGRTLALGPVTFSYAANN